MHRALLPLLVCRARRVMFHPLFLSLSPSLSLFLSLRTLFVLFQSSLLNLCVGRANRRYRLSISLHLAHVHSICGNISDCSPSPVHRCTGERQREPSRRSSSLVIVHLRLILFKYSIRNRAEINRIFGPPPLPSSIRRVPPRPTSLVPGFNLFGLKATPIRSLNRQLIKRFVADRRYVCCR